MSSEKVIKLGKPGSTRVNAGVTADLVPLRIWSSSAHTRASGFVGHVLKPKTSKRNEQNETSKKSKTAVTSKTKRAKQAKQP